MATRPTIALAFVTLALAQSAFAPAASAQGAPAARQQQPSPIVVTPETVDLGIVAPGSTNPGRFILVNRGSKPIKMLSAIPNCKCTAITPVEGKVIEPGGTFELAASLAAPRVPGAAVAPRGCAVAPPCPAFPAGGWVGTVSAPRCGRTSGLGMPCACSRSAAAVTQSAASTAAVRAVWRVDRVIRLLLGRLLLGRLLLGLQRPAPHARRRRDHPRGGCRSKAAAHCLGPSPVSAAATRAGRQKFRGRSRATSPGVPGVWSAAWSRRRGRRPRHCDRPRTGRG